MTRSALPWCLVGFRASLGPAFFLIHFLSWPPAFYIAALFAGILSDVFDGVLARRWGVATPALRRADSNVDTFFYGCAVIVAVWENAAWLLPWRIGLAILFAFLVLRNVVDFLRYRRQPAYHMWSGKLWSLSLLAVMVTLFLGTPMHALMGAMIGLGILNSAEGMIASLILPRPAVDVPTVFHAIALQRQLAAPSI